MLSEIQKAKLEHLFHVLDANKNGKLQLDDFISVTDHIIGHLGLDRDARKSRLIINKTSRLFIQLVIDLESRDMSISLKHWMKFFEWEMERHRGGLLYHYINRTTHHLFALFDLNNDKFISMDEYVNMLTVYNIPMDVCEQSFKQLDRNNDQLISVDELVAGLHDYFYSSDPKAPGSFIFGEWRKKP